MKQKQVVAGLLAVLLMLLVGAAFCLFARKGSSVETQPGLTSSTSRVTNPSESPPSTAGGSQSSPSGQQALTVSSVVASVTAPASSACPTTYSFSAVISANAARLVTYRWERSDGTIGTTQTVTFVDAGSITVTSDWVLSANFTGWKVLHVLTPNNIVSNKAEFTVTCSSLSVSAVTVQVAPTNSDTCSPATSFNATAQVTANGAGTISYRWERSDGAPQSTLTMTFGSAGTQNVSLAWPQSSAGSYGMKFHVLTPNDISSSQANFSLTCPARVNSVSARETSMSGTCASGKTVHFSATIESNSAGDVSYTWLRSDNASGPTETIHFGSPGTQDVSGTWTLWGAYTGWEAVKTTSPNVVTSGHADFSVTCP